MTQFLTVSPTAPSWTRILIIYMKVWIPSPSTCSSTKLLGAPIKKTRMTLRVASMRTTWETLGDHLSFSCTILMTARLSRKENHGNLVKEVFCAISAILQLSVFTTQKSTNVYRAISLDATRAWFAPSFTPSKKKRRLLANANLKRKSSWWRKNHLTCQNFKKIWWIFTKI